MKGLLRLVQGRPRHWCLRPGAISVSWDFSSSGLLEIPELESLGTLDAERRFLFIGTDGAAVRTWYVRASPSPPSLFCWGFMPSVLDNDPNEFGRLFAPKKTVSWGPIHSWQGSIGPP